MTNNPSVAPKGSSSALRKTGATWHRLIARVPFLARWYLALCRVLAAHLPAVRRQQWINSMAAATWPDSALQPQPVQLGTATTVRVKPNNGEFDFRALLGGHLLYEPEVFEFLDPRIGHYDAVVEIGANIGVFTLYFGERLQEAGGKVYAFEPSRPVFQRLQTNVALNTLPNVFLFNAAVGQRSGFEIFHEPEGHLTNGSLVKSFAAVFSGTVRSTPVMTLNAAELAGLLAEHRRILFKIDVEGYEATLLEALAPVIAAKRPDIVLEVLPEHEAEINDSAARAVPGYDYFAITHRGPVPQSRLRAEDGRDCFLTPRQSSTP